MVYEKENKLWLVWKDTNTRERFIVGVLTYNREVYYFKYLENEGKNDLGSALTRGFSLLPAFPERDKEYQSPKLFHVFFNRLASRNRTDVQELFQNRGLSQHCSDFDFLKETGGRLPTDTLEFVEPIMFQVQEEFKIKFNVAGLRYYDIDKVQYYKLQQNSKIILRLEPNNKFDPHAIEVLTCENEKLGYVPVFYSRYIDLSVMLDNYEAKVDRFDPDADYLEKLSIEVKGKSNLSEIIENIK